MGKIKFLMWGIITTGILLQGCLKDEESGYEKRIRLDNEAISEYLDANQILAEKSDNGVYYEILKENPQGREVEVEDVLLINYEMTVLGEGQPLEIYDDTLKPLKFSHSQNALIPEGLNLEMVRMREGEVFRFYIPSHLAFNEYRQENLFGSFTNFIVDVELLKVKSLEEENEDEVAEINSYIEENNIQAEAISEDLYYFEEVAGDGDQPNDYSGVEFHFTRKYLDGSVIETTEGGDPLSVYLNQVNLVEGFYDGLKLMHKGGKATLIMTSKIAFGKSLQVIPQKVRNHWLENGMLNAKVLPYSPVIYEVELLDVY